MLGRTPPDDMKPTRTADGSLTLHSDQWNEHYHSMHGAVQESTHVFIKAGLEHVALPHVHLLEVGVGTGLNLLLTWVRCLEGKLTVDYTGLEPYPLTRDQLEQLGHCEELAWPGLHQPFLERMAGGFNGFHPAMGGLSFRLLQQPIGSFAERGCFDLIYFDAFGPPTQPEMWTAEVFAVLFEALRPGGVLVTYCAKGAVRRTMEATGFQVERLQGPPGKREMLRATKPGTVKARTL